MSEFRTTLQRLRQTPTHFKRTAEGLSDAQLRRPPEEGSWSVHEVLAHLRGAADVQGGWIVKMLAEDTPKIRAVSPRTGMRKIDYASLDFATSLKAFVRDRSRLVKTLSALTERDWSRGAIFTGTTRGQTPTVFDLARGIATHEHGHFAQITAAAAAAVARSR